MLGGHAHGAPEEACATRAADASTSGAEQLALIQPTPSTTRVRLCGVAASAAPTHVQHHGRSYAWGCGQRGPPHTQHDGRSHHARFGLSLDAAHIAAPASRNHGRKWNHGQHGYRPTGGRSAGGGAVVFGSPWLSLRFLLPKSARSRRSAGTPCWAGTPMDRRSGHEPPA